MDYSIIPARTMESLQRYVDHGVPVGGFLQAVLSNDLRKSIGRADSENLAALVAIATWLYNEAPMACWGSPGAYDSWIQDHITQNLTKGDDA